MEVKPRKQSFLLSVDYADNHMISEVNTFALETPFGFTDDQTVVCDGYIFALGDQYNPQSQTPLIEAKALLGFNQKWRMVKLD